MNLEDMKKGIDSNRKLIERLEIAIEEAKSENKKRIWDMQIKSLKNLNKALEDAMWEVYDYTDYLPFR